MSDRSKTSVASPAAAWPRVGWPVAAGVLLLAAAAWWLASALSRQGPAPLLRPASLAALPAGTVFRDCDDCLEMVRVPAGRFEMGSPETETGRDPDEGPVHRVTIRYALAVSRYPVTLGQWRAFMQASHHRMSTRGCDALHPDDDGWAVRSDRSWRNPGFAQGDRHPVVCVGWLDAKAYADWLSARTRKPYRLLSEAEYEYVSRAGRTSPYFWGTDPDEACRYANAADASVKYTYPDWTALGCGEGFLFTSPVGYFHPSPFGLYDTTGNVWSWTADCYHDSYSGAPVDGSAWVSGNCFRRVFRGGSWHIGPRELRAANRAWGYTTDGSDNVGFRVARSE